MSFQITILQDFELIDTIETDCIIGACHNTATDAYPTICYTDCDLRTKARTILAEAKNVKDHLTDEIVEASYSEAGDMVGELPSDENDKGVN